MNMKLGPKGLSALAAVLLIAQIVPFPAAENPPVGQEVPAPDGVRAILRTSCYDCHSNDTVWPWYSRVIPSKWFVRQHVAEGRRHLNFSTWGEYSPDRAARKLDEVVEMVEDGVMPLKSYLRMHGDAVLSAEDAAAMVEWARELAGVDEEGRGGE
jgi:hypothetical protein